MYTCGRFTVMYSRNQQLSSDKKFKYIDIKNGGGGDPTTCASIFLYLPDRRHLKLNTSTPKTHTASLRTHSFLRTEVTPPPGVISPAFPG